jgi:hypothetical protein
MVVKAYAGGPEGFAQILEPVCKKWGKIVCAYPCEVEKVQLAFTVVAAMGREDALLLALYSAEQTLLYQKTTIAAGLQLLLAKHDEWKMRSEDAADWLETMTRRIRNLLRCVSQPMSKNKCPPWMKKLEFHKLASKNAGDTKPDTIDLEADVAEKHEADEEDDEDLAPLDTIKKYIGVKFNTELMLCTRTIVGEPNKTDVSEAIADDPNADAHSMVMAKFSNGDVAEVPGLTFQALRRLLRRGTITTTGKLWQAEHVATHHALHIEQRVDRKLLLSIFEQSKQRLQIRMDRFGELTDEEQAQQLPEKHGVLIEALKFLQPIAELYAKDEVKLEDLKKVRDDKLAALQPIARTTTRAAKRPAENAATKASVPRMQRPAAALEQAAKSSSQGAGTVSPAVCSTAAGAIVHKANPHGEMLPPAMSMLAEFTSYSMSG